MAILNDRLTPEQYGQNFDDIHPPFATRDAALVEANRCLFCYDAPCTKSCPTSIDVPKFIKQIVTDNIKGSAHTILSSNIMGGGCSKVCPVEKLCEGACVYNLMDEEAIPIAKLQRYSTEKAIREKWPLFERKKATGKRVAIIGAGPAGLSCAHVLSREGVEVTIYEKEEKGGGLMTYGIAAYKVTPEFCEEEVSYILSLGGIDIRYGQELGKNIQLDELRKGVDAVYLGFGVGVARQLDIPGEELDGVVDAIRFIYTLRADGYAAVPVGDRVVVIGMGMTAIDAATQAKRLGAKEVTLVYRRTQEEMPCTEVELDLAKKDGCRIIWLAAPKEVIGSSNETIADNESIGSSEAIGSNEAIASNESIGSNEAIGAKEKVTALLCSVMELGAPDASGRRTPVDTGRTFRLETDMIIKAAGQIPFEELVKNNSLGHNKGRISVDAGGTTSLDGVFAGGDCVNGGKEVVDAVQAGKNGAAAILRRLGIPFKSG